MRDDTAAVIKTFLSQPLGRRSRYAPPSPAELRSLSNELVNWNGARLPVIKYNGFLWVVKSSSISKTRRELLVYELAKSIVNAAEVKSVTERDLIKIRRVVSLPANAEAQNTVLIRLAQTYHKRELLNQTLDSAVAGELVFSLWIRRRDADVWNRSYADGIPVFYDLSACLDFEDELFDINDFFSYNRYGYAGSWRIKIHKKDIPLSSASLRKSKDHYSYINTKSGFIDQIDFFKEKIKGLNIKHASIYRKAGYSKQDGLRIRKYLENTLATLDSDAEIMKKILFSNQRPDKDKR